MKAALTQAKKALALGEVPIGCVIVHEGKIIGEGYHHEYGGPHAEINAINSVNDKNLLKESVLYVNLEPCSHSARLPHVPMPSYATAYQK